MKHKSLAAVTLLAVAALALAGCATPSAAPESGGSKPVIRILGVGAAHYTGLTTTKWKKELQAAGYQVELKFVNNPDDAARIVIAGEADFWLISPPEGIKAIQVAQAPLKLLAFTEVASDFVVVGDNSLDGLKSLVGKKVALNTPGSTTNVIMALAANIAGVDPASMDKITLGAAPTRIAALQGGQVAATVVHYSEALTLLQGGHFHIIQDTSKILGQYLQQGVFVSTKFIAANPKATQQAIDVLLDSYRWAATNKKDYMALADIYPLNLTAAQRAELYDQILANHFLPVNGGNEDLDAVKKWVVSQQGAGALPKDVIPIGKWVDNSYVLDYIKRKGKV